MTCLRPAAAWRRLSGRRQCCDSMIITTHEEWTNLFNSIKAESSSSDEKHVFIYACATDADSVCALRILEVGAARPACA